MTQRIMEVMQSTDESKDVPADLSLPVKSIIELNDLERKLEYEELLSKLVMIYYTSFNSSLSFVVILFQCLETL